MKEIKLLNGMVVAVDDDMFEELSKYKWYINKPQSTCYAVRQGPIVNGKQKWIRMHRQIMQAPAGLQVDHIDGDGLNNRKKNLRICTRSQNAMNKKVDCDNKSGYKGVYWNRLAKKWVAQIKINRKIKYLGLYENVMLAAIAYNRAAIELFGEFARINKVNDD